MTNVFIYLTNLAVQLTSQFSKEHAAKNRLRHQGPGYTKNTTPQAIRIVRRFGSFEDDLCSPASHHAMCAVLFAIPIDGGNG